MIKVPCLLLFSLKPHTSNQMKHFSPFVAPLASQDFRNYQYTLPVVKGLIVDMEVRKTSIKIPSNRYNEVSSCFKLFFIDFPNDKGETILLKHTPLTWKKFENLLNPVWVGFKCFSRITVRAAFSLLCTLRSCSAATSLDPRSPSPNL